MSKLSNDKTYLFEQMPVPKAVFTMSVPTVLSSLVMILYNLADTFFVGQLGDPLQNAAVTLAAPVLLAFNAINNLFGVGSSSMMSRALGRQEPETAKKSSAFGFYCALICGLLFSAAVTVFESPLLTLLGATAETAPGTADYLFWTAGVGAAPAILNVVMAYMVRAEGASLHASVGTMSGCILNIILDPFFILPWGLDMGAAGAGLATCLSNCFACCYFFLLLHKRRGSTVVSLSPRHFRFEKKIVAGVCGVGIPASIQNLLNVTGMTVLNNFAAGYGSTAVAAMGIAQKLNTIPFQVSMGISQGIMPIISYNFSAGNVRRMKQTLFFTMKIALSLLCSLCLVYLLFAPGLVQLFMDNATIVEYGSTFLRCKCVALPFLALDFMAVGVFQACGMGKRSLLFAILRKIVLEIPAIFIWNAVWPMYGLACSQATAEVILATAAVIMLRRIFRDLQLKYPEKV